MSRIRRLMPIHEFPSVENAIATRLSFRPFVDTFELHLFQMPAATEVLPRTTAVKHERRRRTSKRGKPSMAETDHNYSPLAPAISPPGRTPTRESRRAAPSPRRLSTFSFAYQNTQPNHAEIALHVTAANPVFENPAIAQFWNQPDQPR